MSRPRSRPRPRRLLVRFATVLLALAVVVPLAGTAGAHDERPVEEPDAGMFPEYRFDGPSVVVCKPNSGDRLATFPAPIRARNEALLDECRFEHIQPAINWIKENGEPGTRLLVMPGVYREEPSRNSRDNRNGAPLDRDDLVDDCAEIAGGGHAALSYAEEVMCPHVKNLTAVLGDGTPDDDSSACSSNLCDLQVEGTGARPEDVIVDGKLRGFDNGMKIDRAGGFYLKNMTFQHFGFNGAYIIETSSATVDSAEGNYNHEYGFLSFLSYVLFENCEGRSNGDGAIYPGASPDVNRDKGLIPVHRDEMTWSTVMRGCRGHHSELGFSGTTGNSIWIHHNEFDHNIAGVNLDSFFPNHPGTPQNHTLVEDNLIHSNNMDYYETAAHKGTCGNDMWDRDYEDGALCPLGPAMLGSGIILPGANFNWFHRNRFYDNWRTGTLQFWVPAEIREQEPVPDAHFKGNCGPDGNEQCPFEETSHWNTYSNNRLAENVPFGFVQPNGTDFTWDVEGEGNCWDQSGDDANTSAAGDVTYRGYEDPMAPAVPPPVVPDCDDSRGDYYSPYSSVYDDTSCATYNHTENPDPPNCDWVHMPPMPDGREPERPVLERLAGDSRIDTAVLASREAYPSGADTVVLARSDLYPDALTAAPLAHARGGPLLLTSTGELNPQVAEEIKRLGASTVVLIGGEGALRPRIVEQLADMGFGDDDIARIAGDTRFDTAVQIATHLPATDAFLAKGSSGHDDGGDGWPDALAVSYAASLLERPILLSAPNDLPEATRAYLKKGEIEAIDIVGGPGAVTEAVAEAVKPFVDEVERVFGEGRLETSLEVAKFAQLSADPTELWIATGKNWPDGIAAGSAVAVDEGILLLVGDEIAGSPVQTWLDEIHPYLDTDDTDTSVSGVVERIRILGGAGAVSEKVADELRETYGATDGDAKGDRSHGNVRRSGRFQPLDGARDYTNVTGYAVMEQRLDGTTRTRVRVQGLPTPEGTMHPVHAHSEPCGFEPVADNPHYMQDPNGPAAEPNEIHPTFGVQPGGVGLGESTVFHHPDDRTMSVMIHTPAEDGATKVLCADLR